MDDQVAFLENETDVISLLQFHPFEQLLVVSDERDYVRWAFFFFSFSFLFLKSSEIIINNDINSIWDLNESKRINKIYNMNPPGSRITSMELLNPKDQTLLLTGSGFFSFFFFLFFCCVWKVMKQ